MSGSNGKYAVVFPLLRFRMLSEVLDAWFFMLINILIQLKCNAELLMFLF